MNRTLIAILSVLILWPLAAFGDAIVTHRLAVTLTPQSGEISVRDEITLPPNTAGEAVKFQLHPALTITRIRGGQLITDAPGQHELRPTDGEATIVIEYRGRIRHALTDISDATGKAQHVTRGWIGDDGVFLSGASAWYPSFDNLPLHFDLQVTLPDGWEAVSQGKRIAKNHWRDTTPQEEIYLVAGRYHRYAEKAGAAEAEVYLRRPDPALAQRYLDATRRYLADYSQLLGPYPYPKFALVENFWESGYGMPSFTLLGPTVIRLPFIVHTSYPHEIVHNWFGNGVYVDWANGNWSEGLTTYLADHRLREQQGTAAAYRHDQLKSWADHAGDGRDFPLARFTGRHGDTSQAVGYAKAMMFFHMIRKKIGDAPFFSGLKRFVEAKIFQQASYEDLRHHWEKASGTSLKTFFDQWLHRTGAPRLAIANEQLKKIGNEYRFTAELRQTQSAAPYPLTVPLRFHFDNGAAPFTTTIDFSTRAKQLTMRFPQKPTLVEVDPDYDCFRQLYPEENPATLSAILGSPATTIVLPASAPKPLLMQYRALAEQWSARKAGKWKIVLDQQIEKLPANQPIILLGWENRFLPEARPTLAGHPIDSEKQSIAYTRQNNHEPPLLIIASNNPRAIAGLARKLPHYGKYSYLILRGEQPTIEAKGQWEIEDTPLKKRL